MVNPACPSYVRLLWLPVLITTVVSGARLYAEVNGQVTTASGGRASWLGITWLALLFGGWFGYRLRRAGSRPRFARAPLWQLLATLALGASVVAVFKDLDPADQSAQALRVFSSGVPKIVATALALTAFSLLVWARLATTLLLYGLLSRSLVLPLTWWAKSAGWDTHYTRFGPPGFEFEMAETMRRATLAQLGFWVPFTVIVGGLVGATVATLDARRRKIASEARS